MGSDKRKNGDIVRTRFYVADTVQDVACRGFIIAEMILNGFKQGAAINLPDGRVEVRIESPAERIEDFKVKLANAMRREFKGNVRIENSEQHVPQLEVLPLMEGSQAHLLLQFKKATDELGEMKNELGGKIDSLGGKIDSLPDRIGKELGSKIDALPRRIAAEMKRAHG